MALAFWLLGLIAVVVIGHLFVRLFKFWKYARIIDKIPGPKGLPLLGVLWDFWVPFEDLIITFYNILRKQQDAGHGLIKLWFGPYHATLFLIKGSSCEMILKSSKYVDKCPEYQVAKNMLGNSLLFCKKELWEKRRKLINSSFHATVLKDFIPIFNEQTVICLQQFEKVEGGMPFDVVPYFRNLSLDMVCETIMGVKVNAQENTSNDFVRALHEIGDIFCMRVFNPIMSFQLLFSLTPYKRQEMKYCEIIHTFARKVVRERMQILEQRKLHGVEEDDGEKILGKKRRLATLDMLIEETFNGQKLTEEEIMYEVVLYITAGDESTADLLSFATFLLGCHPECLKTAQQEVDSVLGESESPVTSEDLARLKYLDAVIKETNRLYPPISLMGREMDEDVVIDGYTIPAKTTVGIMTYVIHRDPEVFPEPDKFDPERFLGGLTKEPSIYEYMPFSQGPRNCIGYKLALFEAKIALARIIRKYDIISHDKPENLKLVASPDLRSYHGLKISLRRRKLS